VGAGLLKPLLAAYGGCALLVAVFQYAYYWVSMLMVLALVAVCLCQLRVHGRKPLMRLVYRGQQWALIQGHVETPVSCRFYYLTPWLVAAKVERAGRLTAQHFAFVSAAATADEWRRLQVLLRDGEQ